MARFFGAVGYGDPIENPPNSGIWGSQMTEKLYSGEVNRISRSLDQGDKVNKDISFHHSISVVADEYAIEHFSKIKYVVVARVYWTVTSVEVQHPRLILTLGSVYNGPKA